MKLWTTIVKLEESDRVFESETEIVAEELMNEVQASLKLFQGSCDSCTK